VKKEELKKLLHRYIKGKCTYDEKVWVEALYEKLSQKPSFDLTEEMVQEDLNEIYQNIILKTTTKRSNSWPAIAAAAIVLLCFSFGFYFVLKKDHAPLSAGKPLQVAINPEDFAPGSNKALLTLSDGSTIALDDANDLKIAEKGGVKITKDKDGLITYQWDSDTQTPTINTLSTPKGGQYQLILSDGTKVWLNAASSITYPTSFKSGERKVSLKGEAYFDVAKNKKQPFKVITDRQELTVLGTQFNINSYDDEPETKTTLLEGSVQISSSNTKQSILLSPGEQSALKENGKIKVSAVNTENAVAWRSGLFQFQDSDIQEAMRQLSRWYNVAIEFEGPIPAIRLWGEVHRKANAIEALEILSYFGLKYKIVTTENTKKIIIIQ